MPEELTALSFSLSDEIGGQPLTPDTVALPTLRAFIEDVEKLVKGNASHGTLANSQVRIEKGSVKLVALVSAVVAADAEAEFQRLHDSGDLDAIQPQRAEVIERWQERARKNPKLVYSLAGGQINRPIRVNGTTQYQHGAENSWVAVERHLVGKVVDIGGKKKPNIHLDLTESGKNISISATEDQLAAESDNKLYREVTVRVQAEQHLRTKQLRKIRFIEFVDQSTEIDEAALEQLWQRGQEAWKEVDSATDWVDSLRGSG